LLGLAAEAIEAAARQQDCGKPRVSLIGPAIDDGTAEIKGFGAQPPCDVEGGGRRTEVEK
jgi:hypothetical protein